MSINIKKTYVIPKMERTQLIREIFNPNNPATKDFITNTAIQTFDVERIIKNEYPEIYRKTLRHNNFFNNLIRTARQMGVIEKIGYNKFKLKTKKVETKLKEISKTVTNAPSVAPEPRSIENPTQGMDQVAKLFREAQGTLDKGVRMLEAINRQRRDEDAALELLIETRVKKRGMLS